MTGTPTDDERIAAQRYGVLQLVRFLSIGFVIAGIAIANDLLPLPYWTGVVLAVVGLVEFFFLPPLLARHWKAGDRRSQGDK